MDCLCAEFRGSGAVTPVDERAQMPRQKKERVRHLVGALRRRVSINVAAQGFEQRVIPDGRRFLVLVRQMRVLRKSEGDGVSVKPMVDQHVSRQCGEKIEQLRIEEGGYDVRPVTQETEWTQRDTAARSVPETEGAHRIRLIRVTRKLCDEMSDGLFAAELSIRRS